MDDRELKKLGVIARKHIDRLGYKSITNTFRPIFSNNKVILRFMAKESLYVVEVLEMESFDSKIINYVGQYCTYPIEIDMYFK